MLYDLTNKQSEFTRRWNSLVLAKEWMLHILFPWANIEIDKDFYEVNMNEEC